MNTIPKRLIRIAITVGIILLIPLVLTIRDGAVEGVGWNWTASDFVIMGVFLYIVGLAIDTAARKVTEPTYRAIAIIGIVCAALVIWAQMAVGAVSQLIAFLLG